MGRPECRSHSYSELARILCSYMGLGDRNCNYSYHNYNCPHPNKEKLLVALSVDCVDHLVDDLTYLVRLITQHDRGDSLNVLFHIFIIRYCVL